MKVKLIMIAEILTISCIENHLKDDDNDEPVEIPNYNYNNEDEDKDDGSYFDLDDIHWISFLQTP